MPGSVSGILLKETKHCHVLRKTEDAPMHPPHPPASPPHSLLPVYEKCYLPSPSTVRKDSQVPKLQRLHTKRIILNPEVSVEEMKDTKFWGISPTYPVVSILSTLQCSTQAWAVSSQSIKNKVCDESPCACWHLTQKKFRQWHSITITETLSSRQFIHGWIRLLGIYITKNEKKINTTPSIIITGVVSSFCAIKTAQKLLPLYSVLMSPIS